MSTSDNLTQTLLTADEDDSSALRTAAELKAAFADNQTPTGEDFAHLIDSAFNQLDGPIRTLTDSETAEVSLAVDTEVSFKQQVDISGDLQVQKAVTVESLKTSDDADIGGTLSADKMHVYRSLEVDEITQLNGTAKIRKTGGQTGPALVVEGNIDCEHVTVDDTITLGGEQAQIAIQEKATPEKPSLLVQHGEETMLAIDEKGQLSLGLNGEQSSAKLHIRYRPDDDDTLFRIDNQANDTTPVAVTCDGTMGIGTASPHNMLDVTESVSIGYDAPHPVSPENSLAVSNRVGVGTYQPMARVDIHTAETEAAVIARSGDKNLLYVNQDGITTDVNLKVSGQSSLGQTTVDHNLDVMQTTSLKGDLTVDKTAQIQGLLSAAADTQLQTVTAAGKATLNKELIVSGDTKHDGAVGIGLGIGDGHNPNAGLHVRERDNQMALRVENKEGHNQLQISGGKISMGETGGENSVALSVYGETEVKGNTEVQGNTTLDGELTVKQTATLAQGATVNEQLTVTRSGDGTHPALKVRVNDNQTAAEISHGEGENEQTLFIATGDKVGIHRPNPKTAFHVGKEARFDKSVDCAETLTVEGKTIARNHLELTGRLNINTGDCDKAQVHIAHDEKKPSLIVNGATQDTPALVIEDGKLGIATNTPARHLDVCGDASVSGHFSVGEILSVGDDSVTLSQKADKPALTVKKTGEESSDSGISVSCDRIGINTTPDVNLHVKGDTTLDGDTQSKTLSVLKKLEVSGTTKLAATGVTGKVTINNPAAQDNIDVHLRQSGLSQTALRIDKTEGEASFTVKSGKTGINLSDPQCTLDVDGDIHGWNTLTIDGELTAKAQSYFEKTAYVKENMAFSVKTPKGRIHIAEQESDDAALRIDYGSGENQTALVARQGKLGIGVVNPKSELDIRGDAVIDGELKVDGTTFLDNYLNVAQDAVFDSDVVVKEKAKLKDQALIGRYEEINPELTPNAQLYIADTHFKEAFRIDAADYPSLVFMDGKLGLGQSTPAVTLDVAGEAYVSGPVKFNAELNVQGDITAINNIEGRGKLDISQKATFGSDVLIRGDLYIEDKTDIEEELTVLGATVLKNTLAVTGASRLEASLDVKGKTEVGADLSVSGDTRLKQNASVNGSLNIGQSVSATGNISAGVSGATKAKLHVGFASGQDGFVFERTDNASQPALILNSQGQVGIGQSAPQATLDVLGDACFSSQLQAASLSATGLVSGSQLQAGRSLSIGGGQSVNGISTDFRLGGDNAADTLLPTQSAVKAYIDNVVVPFGQGGKTYTISTQADFDDVFNRGETTIVDSHTTVLLLPLGNQDYNTTSYVLKNSVRLRQGVAIVGFNPLTTRIVKSEANHRFELIGTQDVPVTLVTFTGFTFDGRGMESSRNGGALYLEYVQDCIFNCRFENHTTWGDGGAIYGVMNQSSDPYTVSHIEARYILNCQAKVQSSSTDVQRNEGGAAYGLNRSVIGAYNCAAEQGGAVAYCQASQVTAEGCSASQNGGAAYRCPQIRLNACDCTADMLDGKGGAAYFCSDMICEGQWLNNNAAEGPHIYASNHLTGNMEERHYWKGDYIGRRIDDGTSVWRTHNE
ncbi:Polymer-forming cytoskeletal [Vibrio aerogenes CECT 7868]|uniref:Polymer-forming cytoskeletal n=1 Tax=Vibrio aerogenes CECT 7868 TaxID=1216006 RepID=A0A1M5Z628_9VIBR|nr:hypothetical protein [Vibrio aerogenes]SHI19660.1 Polymer-forming cytoskeletal [Vibrio aerogenes CECT 7868]